APTQAVHAGARSPTRGRGAPVSERGEAGTGRPVQVVVPAPAAVVVVRHDDPPPEPPDELVPFVVPIVVEAVIVDWSLTDDTVAFGDVSVPGRFDAWRAGWERRWLLDPTTSIERFVAAAVELGGAGAAAVLDPIVAAGCECVVEPPSLAALVRTV